MSTNDQARSDLTQELKETYDNLLRSLKKIPTGWADKNLLKDVKADVYGSPTPLSSAADIEFPDSATILLKPYDSETTTAIEEAIRKADLGVTSSTKNGVITIAVPPLTRDQCAEAVKLIHERRDEAKDSVQKALQAVVKAGGEGQAQELRVLAEQYEQQIDVAAQDREGELLSV
ncbi:ribosome recycling factor [Kitasatospora terrestris]|uniref:Ribosome recycling factor n=1 Tax=Kitasatospora terrestris TaxID=258051 RepID=A0ABP9DB67_9ACTN